MPFVKKKKNRTVVVLFLTRSLSSMFPFELPLFSYIKCWVVSCVLSKVSIVLKFFLEWIPSSFFTIFTP